MQKQRIRNNHSQRGVATIFAVLMMLSLLTFLAVVTDTGRLYLEKRSLQKNADLAALETALRYCRNNDINLRDEALFTLIRNGYEGDSSTLTINPDENGNDQEVTNNQVQVALNYPVTKSFFERLLPSDTNKITLRASATAKACEPTAQLAIRSSLLNVDTSQSELLNTVLGGMLGSGVSLGLLDSDWNALLAANLNLLDYLVELGAEAGTYQSVLNTSIDFKDFLEVAATVLDGESSLSSLAASSAIGAITSDGSIPSPSINIGNLIKIPADSEEAALDANINLFDLLQSTIQLANSENSVLIELSTDDLLNSGLDAGALSGIVGLSVTLKVTEKPQLSAIGNPEDAIDDIDTPYGDNKIYVNSSQVRAYISLTIESNLLNGIKSLLDNVTSGVALILKPLLSLNLVGVLNALTCALGLSCDIDIIDIELLPSNRIDVVLNLGGANAALTNYSCDDGDKVLNTAVKTQLGELAIGKLGDDAATAKANAFSPTFSLSDMGAFPIIDISSIHKSCLLYSCTTSARTPFSLGGVGLKLNVPIAQNENDDFPPFTNLGDTDLDDMNLPEVGAPMEGSYQPTNSQDLIDSLGITTDALTDSLEFYDPVGDVTATGEALSVLELIVDAVVSPLLTIVTDLLSELLDPLINNLLSSLGISVADAEVGAALTCENDKVRLVN